MQHHTTRAMICGLCVLALFACAKEPAPGSEGGAGGSDSGGNAGAGGDAAGAGGSGGVLATAGSGGSSAGASGGTAGNTAGKAGSPGGAGAAGTPTAGMGTAGMGVAGMGVAGNFAVKRFPFPQNKTSSFCAYPSNKDSAFVQTAYNKWKAQMVTSNGTAPSGGLRVQRTENGNDTVSEGIAYGMLAAVYMDDRATFDGLWTYARARTTANKLMHWRIAASGAVAETGSASDADEDIAWALIMAARQWATDPYLNDARMVVNFMWSADVDHNRGEKLKAGDSWNEDVTFPSYLSPAYYRVFAQLSGQAGWMKVVDNSYQLLEVSGGSKGLAPEKTTFAGATVEAGYKYNSCRIPWRIAMDWCWFGEPRAKAYLMKASAFFSGVGANNIVDGYDLNGGATSGNAKAMAFTGPAVVGAMVAPQFQSFLDGGWTRLRDLTNDGGAYNYYQGSLGFLSLLMLSGNMIDFTAQ